jgi:hypothetical protein
MQKWIWLVPAIALWNVMPAAQAQYRPRYGPRLWQPGRYDVRNPPLAPQPWMSPTLRGIYRDAQIATAPWPNRRPQAVPIPRFGPLSPCWPLDPLSLQSPWGPQSSFGPHGIIPREPRVADILDQKQNGKPNPGASAQIPPGVLTQLVNPPKIAPKFEPLPKPLGVVPARHEPFARPSWQRWVWVAAGIFVLSLLAYLLRDCVERKPAPR